MEEVGRLHGKQLNEALSWNPNLAVAMPNGTD